MARLAPKCDEPQGTEQQDVYTTAKNVLTNLFTDLFVWIILVKYIPPSLGIAALFYTNFMVLVKFRYKYVAISNISNV